jgi:hypothetical protein
VPNPTTNPKPSPKPPPVCRKGPPKADGPELVPALRILTAQITGAMVETGLPAAFQARINLMPLPTPYHWAGEVATTDAIAEVAIFKNPLDNNYSVEIEYRVGPVPFFTHTWSDTPPRRQDPLEFADLAYQDPSTGKRAHLTIMS